MKTALLWFMCVVVVAASLWVIADKIADVFWPVRPRVEAQKPVQPVPSKGPVDPTILARLEKIELVLEAVREMLRIPPPDETESRDPDNPGPPPQATLGERLQWIEAEMSDVRRQQNRDLVQIFTRLRRRLDEMEAKLGKDFAPDTRATVADLKKLGVSLDVEANLITVEAAFAPSTRVLEFVAVADGGSVHESLLVVNARPSALKRAIELMGVTEAGDPPYDPAKVAPSSCVYLYLTWPGRDEPIRLEKILHNLSTQKSLDPTPFIFTASRPFVDIRTWDEHVAADVHKHVIALTWNYAGEGVLACPAIAAESENIWMPDTRVLPAPPSPATLYVSKAPRPEWE